MSAQSMTAGEITAVQVLVALRELCPDYGRPPRGRPLWQAGTLLVLTLLLLVATSRGWI